MGGGLGVREAVGANADASLAFVGTYTEAADGSAHGEGIYLFQANLQTGELTDRKLAAKTPNPTWIAIHPSKKYLYCVNEVADYDGKFGGVSGFEILPGGDLRELNTVSSGGAGPADMSLDASGKFAYVANYAGGSVAVLPVHADGMLGEAVDVVRDENQQVGPAHATNAPRDSFAVSGHDAPHAHMIALDPSGKFVLQTDLGIDKLIVYTQNRTGKLAWKEYVALPAGDGPRHFAFHPNGRWVYVIEEEASAIAFLSFDPATGLLTLNGIVSALPGEFAGTSFASEIAVSPDGRFIYSANRLHDTISICSIGGDGAPKLIDEVSTMGDYPRHFSIDASGSLMFVCNQHSDAIATFRIDRETGKLHFTRNYAGVGSPAMIALV